MSAIVAPPEKRRGTGDILPRIMLAVVIVASIIILCHLTVVLWLAWTSGSPGDPDLTYTTRNFVEVFSDQRTYRVLIDTFAFAFISLAIALVFGMPIAWIAERTDFRAKTMLFTLMAVGLLIPGFAAAMGWLFLLHPRIGLLNRFLIDAFSLSGPPLSITSIIGMGWVQGLNLAPLAFIMTAAVFRSMDPTLEEAAEVHGGGAWRVLRRYGLAAALSTVALAIAALMSWWYGAMQQRSRQFAVVAGRAYRPKMIRLGRRSVAAWLFIGSYLALSKIMPIMLLIWSSLLPFFQLSSSRAFMTVSLTHYFTLPWELVLTAMGNTAILAVLTPTATLAISLAFSWIVLRSRYPGRSLFDFIAFLPHAVPSIVFGVGALLLTLFVLQRALPLYGTIWILLLVFTIARISYGTRMTNSGLIQIHPELEESAQMSGASLWEAFRRISVPLLAPTLFYAWLWIALLTFRELTLAVILSTADNITFPVVVWSLWLGGGLGQASALAIVMLLMMIPLIVLYWLFARRLGIVAT